MTIPRNVSATILLLALISAAYGESTVWRVSKDGNHVFVGGTIHFLRTSDYPLPEEFDEAYRASDHLVFEADVANDQAIAANPEVLQKLMYTDGRTLETVLDTKTYALLQEFSEANGIPLEMMNYMKPGLVVMQLTATELLKLGMSPTAGVDLHYGARADADGKTTGYLETVEMQIDLLANLGNGIEDEIIEQTIRDIKVLPEKFGSMMSAWRSGDTASINQLMVASFDDEYPKVYNRLLVNRNKDWVPKIEHMFTDNRVEYVLVGAAHLVGDDSVLVMLRERGYKVEKL